LWSAHRGEPLVEIGIGRRGGDVAAELRNCAVAKKTRVDSARLAPGSETPRPELARCLLPELGAGCRHRVGPRLLHDGGNAAGAEEDGEPARHPPPPPPPAERGPPHDHERASPGGAA